MEQTQRHIDSSNNFRNDEMERNGLKSALYPNFSSTLKCLYLVCYEISIPHIWLNMIISYCTRVSL